MSDWRYSIVLVCQAADQADSNMIAEALGYGPDTFSLPAGPEGATEPTHYLNHSFGAQAFVDMVGALYGGSPPEGLPLELLPALSRMVIGVTDGGDPQAHVTAALTALGITPLGATQDAVQIPAESKSVQSVSTLDQRSGDTRTLSKSRV